MVVQSENDALLHHCTDSHLTTLLSLPPTAEVPPARLAHPYGSRSGRFVPPRCWWPGCTRRPRWRVGAVPA